TPVIATPKGAEGLTFRHLGGLVEAEAPGAFADAVVRLLSDPEERRRRSRLARAAVQDYDWVRIQEQYLALIDQVLHGHRVA
ncbi:MAG: glycosyl transferase family 1, partial [Thermoflexus sp.]